MALNRSNKYPGRFLAPTAARPQGAFKNRTSPTAQDGSYLEADWANDWDGFFARILTVAGVTPNGNVDSGTASQLYDALLSAMPGRLIKITVFTENGTFTAQNTTKKIRVRGVGTGGTGAGSAAVSSANVSCLSGGASAGWAEAIYESAFSSIPVTVGMQGAKGYGNGGPGGQSSFGSLMVIPGGSGGVANSRAASEIYYENGGVDADIPVISGQSSGYVVRGSGGERGKVLSGFSSSGKGGDTPYGPGGKGRAATSGASFPGFDGNGYGSGGGGAAAASSSSQVYGGFGMRGIFIVEEYA
ncbi:hypothetical protein AAM22_gp50 [Pantoea phage vB_PagM_AAM22]|nr:hypothetical protein AAM22_gp50 [Pantoea phage vB_PagM_AAM22]